MTNSWSKVAEKLLANTAVATSFAEARAIVCANQLGIERESIEVDWPALLEWSAALALSEEPEHATNALLGATAALLTGPEYEYAAAVRQVLLNAGNGVAAEVFTERGPAGLASILNDRRSRLASSVIVGSTFRPATRFQTSIWKALHTQKPLALSGPTSCGKSFLLKEWLADLLDQNPNFNIAYLVPSRALIRQVGRDLMSSLSRVEKRPRIVVLPSQYDPQLAPNVFVMTQERFDRLLSTAAGPLPLSALVVDEAHKIVESDRGGLLRKIRDEVIRTQPDCRVVMACPYVENPEVLLPEASAQALQSKTPTVVQNLVWAQKSRGRRWSLRVIHGDQPIELPELTLDETVDSHKATAAISVKLSSGRPGTIVFANGPAEAETLATLISGLLKNEGLASPAQELLELAELSRTHIHRDYTLAETVTSGVGFHYGPMPEILRREQERLFADGTLPILVCTATLLEGVNLPCRLLVVRGPKEGRKTPMAPQTFWNLAGRAGRLGKDKSGTVVVIDPHIEKQWPNGPPTASVGLHLDRPGTELASDALRLVAYSHETDAESNRSPVFEQALGELVNAQHLFDSLEAVEWWRRLPLHAQRQLADRAKALLGDNGVPGDLARRHSTVNPVFIGQLVRWLKGKSVEELIALSPVGPAEPNAALKLAEDMARCDRWLGSDFGGDKARNYKANLTIKWARGERLSRILDERVRWVRRHKSKGSSTAAVIRDVFKVIDEFARFKVPKYVGCYAGCISLCLREQGLTDLSAEVDGLEEQYEVGAAERTTMSLMSVGLSRTAAVEVARLIPRSEMSMIDVINWIQSANLDALDIPPVVAREARAAAEETGSYYAIGGWNDAS